MDFIQVLNQAKSNASSDEGSVRQESDLSKAELVRGVSFEALEHVVGEANGSESTNDDDEELSTDELPRVGIVCVEHK